VEASSYNYVCISKPDEQAVEIGWIVLSISVDLHEGVVALPTSMKEGSSHSTANAYVERQRHNRRPRTTSYRRRAIDRAIIDYKDLDLRLVFAHLLDDISYRPFFIPGRNCNEGSGSLHTANGSPMA
jgi:hypothetical protein